jgi:alanine racemase
MQPEISLDPAVLRENARAWRAFAGVDLYAVVKGEGYGWGLARVVRALEDTADAFCVADAEELADLRRLTAKRAIVLGAVTPDKLGEVLRSNAAPTIATVTELEVAARILNETGAPLRLRVGLRPAAAWSGLSLEELRAFAPALAAAGAEVELWSHITDWEAREQQAQTFAYACALVREAGVNVAGTDLASTMPLSAQGPLGTAVRIGVGLFGSTGGAAVPGVRCALRVVAPVIRMERHYAGTRVGYGGTMLRMGESIATARCGYADGLPKALAGADDILSVGMQYVTVRTSRVDESGSQVILLDETSDLDAFASHSGRLPHEIVTGFGNCARANGVSVEV